jgi:TrmH family RNA methyltransferase
MSNHEIKDLLRVVGSPQNALVKDLRRAFQNAELTEDGYCAIESVRMVEEAIRSGLRFKALFFSESGQGRAGRLLPQMSRHTEALLLPDKVFNSAVGTGSPQGVAALVKIREHKLDEVLLAARNPLLVVALGVQDPGNLGTIVRSAEAFGATAVVTANGTVSHYNAKAIRASAGSLLRLPVVRGDAESIVPGLRAQGMRLLATSSHSGAALPSVDLAGPVALFIGNEGSGLSPGIMSAMDLSVLIPIAAGVESLNAGIAASIILYEAARQRAITPGQS